MENEEGVSRTHKVGVVARDKTDARYNQAVSIRKEKRQEKFKRELPTSTTAQIDDRFLAALVEKRVSIEELVNSTLSAVFDEGPGFAGPQAGSQAGPNLEKGLLELWVLCQNTQHHCHEAVIRLLPVEKLLKRLTNLLRDGNHVERIAMIIQVLIHNPKQNATAWNSAIYECDIIRGMLYYIKKNTAAPKRGAQGNNAALKGGDSVAYFLFALVDFLRKCDLNVSRYLPEVRDAMVLLIKEPRYHSYVIWYLTVMFAKWKPEPYEPATFCTEDLWNLVLHKISTIQLDKTNEQETYYTLADSIDCLLQHASRGPKTTFLRACEKVGPVRFIEILNYENQDPMLMQLSAGVLAHWNRTDAKFCAEFMSKCTEVLKRLLLATKQKAGSKYNTSIAAVRRSLVCITMDYSADDAVQCSKILVQEGFFWQYVCDLAQSKEMDRRTSCAQMCVIRNTLADVVNWENLYSNIDLFKKLFNHQPALFIEAMTNEYGYTEIDQKLLICEILSTCIEWSDRFGLRGFFRQHMEEDEDNGLYYTLERVATEEVDDALRSAAEKTLKHYGKKMSRDPY